MSDILQLRDGTSINLQQGSNLSNLGVTSLSKEDMVSVWNKLTNDNLMEVKILNADGDVVGSYKDLVLESETSIVNQDNTITTKFNLREKTEVELLKEEIERMKTNQEVMDGAIMDLGSVVSEMQSV